MKYVYTLDSGNKPFVSNKGVEYGIYQRYNREGEISEEGKFTISDDVIHYYFDVIDNGVAKEMVRSMALEVVAGKGSFISIESDYGYSETKIDIERTYITFGK